MKIDWAVAITICLAIVAASLVEHFVITPRLTQATRKGSGVANLPTQAKTAAEWIAQHYPGAHSVDD